MEIYLNPTCSKCRKTMEILAERGVEPTVVEYLQTPLTAVELRGVLGKLGFAEPAKMIRFKEPIARKLRIADTDHREIAEWLELIVANPALLQRPIIVDGDRAVIGRPPEAVLELLS